MLEYLHYSWHMHIPQPSLASPPHRQAHGIMFDFFKTKLETGDLLSYTFMLQILNSYSTNDVYVYQRYPYDYQAPHPASLHHRYILFVNVTFKTSLRYVDSLMQLYVYTTNDIYVYQYLYMIRGRPASLLTGKLKSAHLILYVYVYVHSQNGQG